MGRKDGGDGRSKQIGHSTHDKTMESTRQGMGSRNLIILNGPDILISRHTAKGTFTMKEAYDLQMGHDLGAKSLIWKKIWKGGWWPKVSHFLWLVSRGHILTWTSSKEEGSMALHCVGCANKIMKTLNICSTPAHL